MPKFRNDDPVPQALEHNEDKPSSDNDAVLHTSEDCSVSPSILYLA